MSLLWLLALTGNPVTGVHEALLKSPDISNTNSGLVAGQMISNSFALVSRIVNGGGSTWNSAVLVTLPCGVKIVIGPEVAPGGTMAVMRRSRLLVSAFVKLALAPLKRTGVAPVKLVPVSVTFAPGIPLAGENCVPVNPGGGVGYHRSVNGPDCAPNNPALAMTEMA